MSAARQRAGARQQPEDVRLRAPVRPAHRRDGVGGPEAARHPDARRVSQRRRGGARRQRIDQLHQAPAGDGRSKPASTSTSSSSSTISASTVPVLSAVAPNGTDTIEAFEAAGGAQGADEAARAAARSRRADRDRPDGRATTSPTPSCHDEDVIRPLDRPFSDKPPIVVLHGSLAPESAIVKLGVRGPGSEDAVHGHGDRLRERPRRRSQGIEKGDVKPGHVLVVRGMGPKGGPGMAGPASRVVFALDAAGLTRRSGVRQRRPALGAVPQGHHGRRGVAGVGGRRTAGARRERRPHPDRRGRAHARPRRARGGARRAPRAPRRAGAAEVDSGYLSIYQRSVQPMSTGAVLIEQK